MSTYYLSAVPPTTTALGLTSSQNVEPRAYKPSLLMVCAHEPTADPRITWEAASAARDFDVTVLGLATDAGIHPQAPVSDAYRTIRIRPNSVGVVRYLWLMKDTAGQPSAGALAILIGVCCPFLIMLEAGLSLGGKAMRQLIRLLSGSSTERLSGRGRSAPDAPNALSESALGRLRFIFAVMRNQFAPAADVFGSWIDKAARKPDVVHCNDLDTLLVGVLAKRHFGSRVIYDAHEFYPESHSEGRWFEIKLLTAMERLLVRKADAVVTVNPMLADVIRNAYGLAHVSSVPNAELWVDPPDRPSFKSAMTGVARGRVKFLFQGRFAKRRGIEDVIRAWAEVDGEEAALFLRGPENPWRQAAIEMARGLGLLDRSIYFLEPVPEHLLIPAAAEADVGLIPYTPLIRNDRFSCPNKLSQYLHAGLLVLSNELPYVKSVLESADAGLSYNSSDPSSLPAAVARIVADREFLRRSQANALRYAKETFNWQTHAEDLMALYRRPSMADVNSGRGDPAI